MSRYDIYILTGSMMEELDNASIVLDDKKQNFTNKKIYFDSDGTEIKIGYDDQTGVGFVEIINE